jgi:hypothetical protein
MSEDNLISRQSTTLPKDKIVYRAILNNKHVDEGRGLVELDPFLLRTFPEKDEPEKGISLTFSIEACLEKFQHRTKPIDFIVSLTVGQILNVGIRQDLDIYVSNDPNHPQIMGLPCPRTQNTELRRAAGLLAKPCQIINICSWRALNNFYKF